MSKYPVGARWEVKVGYDNYYITLLKRDGDFEVWYSASPHQADWYPSYETARRGIYLDGSGIRLKRVK